MAASARADSAVAWGSNYYGELGDGTKVDRNLPVAITGLASGVTDLSEGGDFGLAIRNGAALTWGDDYYGELGNGINGNVYDAPVGVTGLTSGVTAVAGGDAHSLAIQNGAAIAWGLNNCGQLGNDSNSNSNTPVGVIGLSSGVTAIAGGGLDSLAIQNGAAKAWGFGNDGLGNGTNSNSSTPVNVSGLNSGVTAIAAGGRFNLAIQNGAVKAWGYGFYGAQGNGSNNDNDLPVAVTGLTSGVTAIAAGSEHGLAIQNGNVYAWGENNAGQLGNGLATNSNIPVLVLDTTADLVAVAAGVESSYALSSDGSLWVWGDNGYGELGLGTVTQVYTTPEHLLAPSGYVFTSIDADPSSFSAVATLAAVPEPVSISALGLLGVTMLGRRRWQE